MSIFGDMEAHAHFEYPKKNRCGLCANCQTVKRWKDVYWKPFVDNGGDIKWAKKQMKLDFQALPCQKEKYEL